ncbi:MAG: hypothetical protein J6Z30_08530 [Pyramidobacter sp.]|nr:hypothetical protein [Pyramidobacter sp.]
MCQIMEDLIMEEKRADAQALLRLGVSKEIIMAGLRLTEEQFEALATEIAS